MARKAPDKAHREGITVIELMDMVPDETTATAWFEDVLWGGERYCGHCGSTRTKEVPNAKPMPYWCTDCRSYFSVKTGTAITRSKVPLRKWAMAIYLCLTSLKSVSSMKLHRCPSSKQMGLLSVFHKGGCGSSLFDVKPLGFDGSSLSDVSAVNAVAHPVPWTQVCLTRRA